MTEEKLLGNERREQLLQWLKQSESPLTGSELGERANVSRQVIVGDITLLKAQGIPILATSRGYLYTQPANESNMIEKTIVCSHRSDQTEEELNILVDHGILVKDVAVEHPIYGDLRASIMVSNRLEVQQFIKRVQKYKAAYLSTLSEDGIHMHTIASKDAEMIERAEQKLREAGILVE